MKDRTTSIPSGATPARRNGRASSPCWPRTPAPTRGFRPSNHQGNPMKHDFPAKTPAMAVFSIEHGESAYWTDFGIYGAMVAALTILLLVFAPHEHWLGLVGLVALGAAAWTLMEYALHRFVLHGLEPFLSWHA